MLDFLKKPSTTLTSLLLVLSVLLSLSGCTKQSAGNGKEAERTASNSDGEWVYSLSYTQMPENFGKIRGISASNGNIFVAGSAKSIPSLYLSENNNTKLKELQFDNSPADAKTIYAMTTDKSGEAWILAGEMPLRYYSDGQLKTNDDYSGRYSIINYNTAGDCIGRFSTEPLGSRQLLGILADDSGHLFCWDKSEIDVYSKDGSKLFDLELGSKNIMSVAKLNGNIIAHVSDVDKTGIYSVNMAAKDLGEYVADAKACFDNSFGGYTDCRGDKFLINNGREILAYNNSKDYDSVLNWLECGVDGTQAIAFQELKSGEYAAAFRGESRFATIKKTYSKTARQVLTLAASYLSRDLSTLIAQFNSSNKDYKIVSQYYETEEDLKRLNTEVISGKAPDIYDFTYMPLESFKTSGALLDLNPYLNDTKYKLVGPVKAALESDGKLYSLPNSFAIDSFVASGQYVGNKTSWTTDEMNQIVKEHEGMHSFESFATKDELLKWVTTFSLGNYIDEKSDKCSFNSNEFINLLKMCNEMPTDSQIEDIESYNKKALLKVAPIQNILALSTYAKDFAGDYTFIGFPNDKGNGSLFDFIGIRLAISAQSKHKQAAWDFVQMMLDDKYQKKLTSGLPVVQAVLDEQMNDAACGRLTDYQGNMCKISDNDINKLKALIADTAIVADNNSTIQEIIKEEASSYFGGSKTAEDAAATIQSRASIYLSEHR